MICLIMRFSAVIAGPVASQWLLVRFICRQADQASGC